MNEDAILLRRYVDEGGEIAFTRLVHNHVDLVYSAALRRTGGNPHAAADVAQEVFTALAAQARKLMRHPALSAWLHATTRNIALNHMRSERRRKLRQNTAVVLETTQPTEAGPEWERLKPVLDAAIDALPERERAPIVLRLLEGRPFKEIGAALAISEDAARVRTDRAIDKLRAVLTERGIASTAAALSAAVSAHGTVVAPAGLASLLAGKSLAAATGSTGLLATVAGFMSAKIITTALVSALAAFLLGNYVTADRVAPSSDAAVAARIRAALAVQAALRADNDRLKTEVDRLSADIQLRATNERLAAERAATAPPMAPLPGRALGLPPHEIRRSVLNNLRQLKAGIDEYAYRNKRPPSSIHDIVGVADYITFIRPVDGEDYANLPMDPTKNLVVTTAGGMKVSYGDFIDEHSQVELPPAIARMEAQGRKLEPAITAAKEAYRLANRGKDPKEETALIPFFRTPEQGADFVEYLEARKSVPKYDQSW
jgi:RNA polymerase sigma factor (sigma-70 family)